MKSFELQLLPSDPSNFYVATNTVSQETRTSREKNDEKQVLRVNSVKGHTRPECEGLGTEHR